VFDRTILKTQVSIFGHGASNKKSSISLMTIYFTFPNEKNSRSVGKEGGRERLNARKMMDNFILITAAKQFSPKSKVQNFKGQICHFIKDDNTSSMS